MDDIEGKKKISTSPLAVLNIVIFSILVIINGGTAQPQLDQEIGTWYAFLRGESIFMPIHNTIMIPFLVFWAITLFKKKFRERFLGSRLLLAIQVFVVTIVISGSFILSQYYDAVYVNDNSGYTFVANRVFEEQKTYTLENIVQCHMDGTSDIWVKMSDGEKFNIHFGIASYSKNLNNASPSKFTYEVHKFLAENDIPLTISNRDKILREIEKYQDRSSSLYWHEYLPQIVANIP